MKFRGRITVVPSIFLCAAVTCSGQAASAKSASTAKSASGSQASGDWPMYGHDDGSSRYSPLTQISTDNVSKLKRAWTFHMTPTTANISEPPAPPAGGGGGRAPRGGGAAGASGEGNQAGGPPAGAGAPAAPGGQGGPAAGGANRARPRRSEATPLVVDGILYLASPFSRVVALDPTTGTQIWEYQLSNNDNASTRGVAYWPGDGKALGPRIVFGTAAGSLIALDAKTGKPAAGFGVNGIVDFKESVANGYKTQIGLSSPPSIYKNVIITGIRVQEQPSRGPSGDTRGWDAITGKLLWTFHSVPHPGEPGNETWETPDSWKDRSGANAWGFLSVDKETGTVFVPLGGASQDEYGGDRKGDDLYSQTLVALDALTGKKKWHFQVIRHDTWDYDFGSAPILATVRRGGKTIPVVVQTNKTGLVWILDRRTGKPVYGMEERPVPTSDVPGEFASATEPFPLKPAPLARNSFKKEELANVTPEHAKACQDLFTRFPETHNDGPFTRFGLKPSVVFPGTWGGSNYQGGTYDPKLNYIFWSVNDYADYGQMVPSAPGSPVAYERKGPLAGKYDRFADTKTGWPCQMPPWGELVALNLNTGDYVWRQPFGTIPELEAKGIMNTGSLNMGGGITTAGGLLFIGATPDQHFRAYDEKTGKMLWDTTMEAGGGATPITYRGKDGKQYVVIVATGTSFGGGNADVVAAYALP